MGKFKPHKGIRKRMRVTATGKLVRRTAGACKLMSTKSGRRKLRLRRKSVLTDANLARNLLAVGLKYN
ncbi:MAG: 50S ribosomal protein L35 [Phycisphaerae bacterium]